jgi:cytochrome c oxidase subunit 2
MPFLTPPSSIADRVDSVFLFIFILSVLFLVFITFLMIYFAIRYSRERNPKAEDIEGHTGLEIAWTVIPLVLFLIMFYFGWTNFEYMRNPPRDAMVIEATGRQWAWSFKYPDGKQTDEMYVALNRPVKVELRSADVLHGFYISAFRVKADVVPGKTNFLWFTPDLVGSFDIQCTVICGVHHTYMLSKVHVLPEEDFKAWYFGDEKAPQPGQALAAVVPASEPEPARGEDTALAALQSGNCLVCHSLDGTEKVGPTFKGLFGSKRTVVADGEETEVLADEVYLTRSIREPAAEVVKGYPPAMPPGMLTDQELKRVLAYMKTLQ